MGAFGDKFRKAREGKELSFDDVSNVIKISPRMLKAIEEENFDQLPGGVFNKGFIRAYAKHLALDPEEAISEYLECVRQAQVQAQQAWQPEPAPEPARPAAKNAKTAKKATAVSPTRPGATDQPPVQVEELPELHLPRAEDVRPARKPYPGGPTPEIPWRLIGAAAVVVILGILLWSRHSHTAHSESTPTNKGATAPAAIAPSSGSAQSSSSNAPPPQPPAAVAPATAPDQDKNEDKNDVTVRNFGKPLPKASEPATGALTLVVRASENSWISVVADGQVVAEETLIAPANNTFHASNGFVVKVGNAAAVSFLINGKEVAPQGAESEVKTLTFDSSGLKSAP